VGREVLSGRPSAPDGSVEWRTKMKEDLAFVILNATGNLNFSRQLEWRTLLKWLQPRAGEKVLDVACGSGTFAIRLAGAGCIVTGIDSSGAAVTRAKKLATALRAPCEFSVQDVEHVGLKDARFDIVVCSSALQLFKRDLDALREMCRVLKPSGRLLLTCDSGSFPMERKWRQAHTRRGGILTYYTPQSLRVKLESAGFELARSMYLVTSRTSDFFFRLGIRETWGGVFWSATSAAAYPFCLVSDYLVGRENRGHSLLVEAIK